MDAALRQYGGGALESYSSARFVYFLESLTALADQLAAARAKNKSVGAVRGPAASRRDEALAARENLLSPLLTFAGSRAPEINQLNNATGTIDPDDRLGESLADLAALVREWLALADEDSVFLASEAGLRADLATMAPCSENAQTRKQRRSRRSRRPPRRKRLSRRRKRLSRRRKRLSRRGKLPSPTLQPPPGGPTRAGSDV